MDPKEYMAEAGRLRRRIERKENEIAMLRVSAEGMMGGDNSDMPKSDSKNLHKMESAVCKIIALQEEVSEIQKELDTLMSSMREKIQAVNDDDARDLLTKRYLEFKPWKLIISDMSYCKAHVFRLHNRALELMKKMRPNET